MRAKVLRLVLGWVLLTGVAVVLQAGPAAACSCARSLTPQQSLTAATTAFTGRLVSVDEPWISGHATKLHFEVQRVWKGTLPRQVTVRTPPGGSCGISATEGHRYTIYGSSGGDGQQAVTAELCDQPGTNAIPASFRPGTAPVSPPGFRRPPLSSMIIVLGAGLALWRVVRLRARRRRRPTSD